MGDRRRYRKKPDQYVVAVQLALEFDGFDYRKWGGDQHGKPGDWLVDNDGDIYTVDQEVFAATYRQVAPGRYVKTTPVWAAQADAAGVVPTKEGQSHYAAGDYLVSNNEDGSDAYCIAAAKFEAMYVLDE
jgi:hypothetical protein